MIQQISIFLENKPGSLARVTKAIGDSGADIRALSMADTSDFGILRLIVDNPPKVKEALKAAGYTVSLTDVVAIGIDDTPGSFAGAVQILSEHGVDVEYMYAFLGRDESKAFVILRVERPEQAIQTLKAAGVRILQDEEVYQM